jgi:putative hydrolase of the HAD superfamily
MIDTILFDWGNTLMVDFPDEKGPMHTWKKIAAVKNADACLAAVSKKFDCHIATNAKDSSRMDILKALRVVGLDAYITDIFCYTEIGFEKPSAEFFDRIVQTIKKDKKRIVMVGDDFAKDYSGALGYGMNAVLFDPPGAFAGRRIVRISDLLDLESAIAALPVERPAAD